MKVHRCGIGRCGVDLAAQALDLLRSGELEQRSIQRPAHTGSASIRVNGDLIDIQERLLEPGEKILEFLTVISAPPIKDQHVSNDGSVTGHGHAMRGAKMKKALKLAQVQRCDRR